ncbi:MAG: hypothetical protein CM1200mP14_14240 [Gammaproteobacteria bacterium]|nr:MAG: hypothetical protein CM1200mP14_14240 [Gammaproteobacteria bacterium]
MHLTGQVELLVECQCVGFHRHLNLRQLIRWVGFPFFESWNWDVSVRSSEGKPSGSVTIVIRALPAAELSVEFANDQPFATQALPLQVIARNRLGEVVDDPDLAYASSDESVAVVDPAGLVFARAEGTARLSASTGTVRGGTVINVRADPGLSYSLTPTEAQVRTGMWYGCRPWSGPRMVKSRAFLNGR